MNASSWESSDDLYRAFFHAVQAPAWHGKNLNAIRDSIASGQINKIEVPYRLVFTNYASLSGELKQVTDFFIEAVSDLKKEGISVDVRIEN